MFKEFYIQKATLRRPQVSEWVSFAFNALTLLLNIRKTAGLRKILFL